MSKLFRLAHELPRADADASADRIGAACLLIDAAPEIALRELERGLRWHLYKPAGAGELRQRELGFLRQLVTHQYRVGGREGDLPYVERAKYDDERPPNAPSSEQLQKRFGSWAMACVSASVIDEDGSYRRGVTSPPVDRRLVRYALPYTFEECLDAIRECGADLGRVPTSQDYVLWRRLRCAALRARGITPRTPHCYVIYRFFPDAGENETRWRAAVQRAEFVT